MPWIIRINGRTQQIAAQVSNAASAAGGRRHRRARDGCARRGLSGRSQPRTARGGRDPGRPGAGAGRRWNRQNPCPDNADRPHPQPRPRPAARNSVRHLHQQGGARDETARRPDGRPDRRGHALARHLPFDRRENPAPPCRNGRPEKQLHHSGHRRPDPRRQTAAGSREARRETMAGAGVRHAARRLEKPRPDARPGSGRRGVELRQRQGQEALHRLSGAAQDAQRRRLRRPAAGEHPAVPPAPGRAPPVPAALQVHSGRRISGHQRRAVFVAAVVVATESNSTAVIPGRHEVAGPGDPGQYPKIWIPGSGLRLAPE